jgi:hypothetical protein
MPGYMEAPDAIAVSLSDAWFARSLTSAAQILTYKAPYPCEIYEIIAIPGVVQTAVVPVLNVTRTPLGGSPSSILASITMSPAGAAAGSVWRNKLFEAGKSFKLNIGDSVNVAVGVVGLGTVNLVLLGRRSPQVPPAIGVNYQEVTS